MSKFRTHYDNLKVARNAPDSIIRAAYKTLMQQYHPDKFEGSADEALRIAKLIKQSYEVLIDPVKRAEHDHWISAQETKNDHFEKTQDTSECSSYFENGRYYSDEDFYDIAAKEIKSGNFKDGIMAKAFSESFGDEKKAAALYIKLRVISLINEQEKNLKDFFIKNEESYTKELINLGCKVTSSTHLLTKTKKWRVITKYNDVFKAENLTDFPRIVDKCKEKEKHEQDKNQCVIKLKKLGCKVIEDNKICRITTKYKNIFLAKKLEDLLSIINEIERLLSCENTLDSKGYLMEWNGIDWVCTNYIGNKKKFRKTTDLEKFVKSI